MIVLGEKYKIFASSQRAYIYAFYINGCISKVFCIFLNSRMTTMAAATSTTTTMSTTATTLSTPTKICRLVSATEMSRNWIFYPEKIKERKKSSLNRIGKKRWNSKSTSSKFFSELMPTSRFISVINFRPKIFSRV